jgi:hypothetical protein
VKNIRNFGEIPLSFRENSVHWHVTGKSKRNKIIQTKTSISIVKVDAAQQHGMCLARIDSLRNRQMS